MTASKLTKETKTLIAELNASDDKKVLKALKAIKKSGNEHFIEPLVHVWVSSESTTVQQEITFLLSGIKEQEDLEQLVNCLSTVDLGERKAALLAIFWNLNIDLSDYISTFVQHAVSGNYMECLEVLTIIENLDPPLPEEQLLESQIIVRNHLLDNSKEDKTDLVRGLLEILVNFDVQQ